MSLFCFYNPYFKYLNYKKIYLNYPNDFLLLDMNKHLKILLQLLIFVGLGVGFIIWRYNVMDIADKQAMFNAFKNVRWIILIPIFLIGFLSHFFRALRWKLLLKPLDIHPSTINITFSVLIGYLANTLVPRLGEVAKCTILAKYEQVPTDKMIGTIIAERAFDVICLLLILLATLFLEKDIIGDLAQTYYQKVFINDNGDFIWFKMISALVISLLIFACIFIYFKKSKNNKIKQIITGLSAGVSSILILKQRGLFMIYTTLIWLMYTLMIVVGYYAIPETAHLSFVSALAIITFGSFGMIITPGGIGTYPIIVAQVLLLYGINEGIGMAFGWICWSAQTGIVLLLGISSLILLPIVNRNKNGKISNFTR